MALLLIVTLTLSLCACNDKNDKEDKIDTDRIDTNERIEFTAKTFASYAEFSFYYNIDVVIEGGQIWLDGEHYGELSYERDVEVEYSDALQLTGITPYDEGYDERYSVLYDIQKSKGLYVCEMTDGDTVYEMYIFRTGNSFYIFAGQNPSRIHLGSI